MRSLLFRWSRDTTTTACRLPPVVAYQISPRLAGSELLVKVDSTRCRREVVSDGIFFSRSTRL